MSEDPFSDPILEPPARGRSNQRPPIRDKMSQEIQEVQIKDVRDKPSRSAAPGGSTAPPVPPKKRSQSQDNVLQAAAAAEKARAAKTGKSNKKGGLHVDVIDRLDYSGVGPATFHHDGPFDACAPSRNRHRTKAPMLAWTPSQNDEIENNGILGAPDANAKKASLQSTLNSTRAGDSPYAAAASSPTTKKSKTSKDGSGQYENVRPSDLKRRDTLADAWGKGEPEPFEEFFAESVLPAAIGHGDSGLASAASSIYKDKDGSGNGAGKSGRRTNGGVRRPTNRPPLPPPQPIFPEAVANEDEPISIEVPTNTGGPNRSRSLMYRIKKMRDAPNVPVGDYDEKEVTSGSSSENHNGRPTHRSQNSRAGSGNKSPTATGFGGDTPGSKALPGLPPPSVSPRDERAGGGYFDKGIGRKASIMQKVRGVVVGKK